MTTACRSKWGETMERNINEIKNILELAINEVDYAIPPEILEQCIEILEKYQAIKSMLSWAEFPDEMGKR